MSAKDIVKFQFQPGKSGNPAGRKKGTKTKRIKDLIIEVLNERTTGKRGGRSSKITTMTKREKMLRAVINKAVAAEPWFVQFVTERTEGKTPDQIIMTDPDKVVEIE